LCQRIRRDDDETNTADALAILEGEGALAAIKGGRTIAQLTDQFDVHPNQITTWKTQLEGGAADVFGPGGGAAATPPVDVKALHAKIGELTLENDFLEGALSKAGLLNAKRWSTVVTS
jgi:transposase